MQIDNLARTAAADAPKDLRSWLAHLAERGKLAVAREGVELADELAAISKRLERERSWTMTSRVFGS